MIATCELHSALRCASGDVSTLLHSAFLLMASAVVAGGSDVSRTGISFEELLRPLLGPAYGVALHLTRNRPDAEDLVQDAALLAFRGFGTFQAGSNFKAWFYRIIYNTFLSKYRQRRSERGMLGLEDASELYIQLRTHEAGLNLQGSDPVKTAIGRMESEQVAAALQAVPEEYRVVATMYFLEEFSYQEIAEVLGIPIGTVRSRLHRGRKMLQKRLWQLAVDQGLVPAGSQRGGTI
jgi:RNA polymerase sigma-70 factor (ECF subfamily)